jgi:hypothetical protein
MARQQPLPSLAKSARLREMTEPAECAVCGIGAYRIERCRGVLRRAVVTLAEVGERDPDRLCNKALVAVGFLPQ